MLRQLYNCHLLYVSFMYFVYILIVQMFVFSINLQIKEGSFIGIVGQVGSGKSTLLSAILGETEKLSGDVTVKVITQNAAHNHLSSDLILKL